MNKFILSLFCLILSCSSLVIAQENPPWGRAKVLDIKYHPNKVLYDLTTANKASLSNVLDRVSYLYNLYGADPFDSSIIIIIHGNAIPFFAIDELKKNENMIKRAYSLSVGTSIEFRMCRAAAKKLNYEPKDIHGFVSMVPMADAEIIRLQSNGYAYIQ